MSGIIQDLSVCDGLTSLISKSFWGLNNIPLYGHTTFYLSVYLLMNICVAFTSWLLWMMLLWTWIYRYLFKKKNKQCSLFLLCVCDSWLSKATFKNGPCRGDGLAVMGDSEDHWWKEGELRDRKKGIFPLDLMKSDSWVLCLYYFPVEKGRARLQFLF